MKQAEMKFSHRDEFNRKVIAQKILSLLSSDLEIYPLVIEGSWGTGKTEFCFKMINMAKDTSAPFECVYINAFQFDHVDDPLPMLTAAVLSAIPNEETKKRVRATAVPVMKVAGKVIGKAAVSWALKQNADAIGKELEEAIEKGSGEVIDEGIKELFESFEKAEEKINAFRDALEKATSERKIVLVIDELDRCRPSFALSILEKIKHVFEIKGLSIILATNVMQLQAMVKKQYGHEMEAELYLSKFFGFTIRLPDEHRQSSSESRHNSIKLYHDLTAKMPALAELGSPGHWPALLFEHLISYQRRSLRDIEKFLKNVEVYNQVVSDYKLQPGINWFSGVLILFGIYIHTFDRALSDKIRRHNFSTGDIVQFLGSDVSKFRAIDTQNVPAVILAIFLFALNDRDILNDIGAEGEKQWREEINGLLSSRTKSNGVDIIKVAIRKMQMLD